MGRNEWVCASSRAELQLLNLCQALVVMNNAPVVADELSLHPRLADASRYGDPKFEKLTTPVAPISHIISVLQDEEKAFSEEAGEHSLRLLAAPRISADEKAVYNLLSDIVCSFSFFYIFFFD